jgi:hypothetical protein
VTEPEFPFPCEPEDLVLPARAGDSLEASYREVSMGRAEANEWIADQIAASVRGEPCIRGRCLEIEVQDRVVILYGMLASAEARAGFAGWPGRRPGCETSAIR